MKDSTNNNNNDFTRYICFTLGDEEFAIPLLFVKEVIAVPEVTPVPFSAAHFLGVMNLRGQVISVIDLRTKMGIKPGPATSETAVIICDLAPLCLGVVVDSINSVLAPAPSELAERPDIQSQRSDCITSVYKKDKKLVLMLDIGKALSVEDLQAMKNHSSPSRQAA